MSKSTTGIPIVEKMGAEILERTSTSIKVKMPLAPNINHVGMMYAGSLFTLAEFPVGELFVPQLDSSKAILVLGKASIKYIKPALTDITAEFSFPEDTLEKMYQGVEQNGKYVILHKQELKDANEDLVAITEMQYVALTPPR
jgi:thioesterase domain-containing protein